MTLSIPRRSPPDRSRTESRCETITGTEMFIQQAREQFRSSSGSMCPIQSYRRYWHEHLWQEFRGSPRLARATARRLAPLSTAARRRLELSRQTSSPCSTGAGRAPPPSPQREARPIGGDPLGVFEGKTTGAPVALLVRNEDVHSEDYEVFRDLFRPGHADYTYQEKYGFRDHRGGAGARAGRRSAGSLPAQLR